MNIFNNPASGQSPQTNAGGNGLFDGGSGGNSGGSTEDNSTSQSSEETHEQSPTTTQIPQLPEAAVAGNNAVVNSGSGLLRQRTKKYIRGRFFDKKNVGKDIFGRTSAAKKHSKTPLSASRAKQEDSFVARTEERRTSKHLLEMKPKLESSKGSPEGFSRKYLENVIKRVEKTTDAAEPSKQKKGNSRRF